MIDSSKAEPLWAQTADFVREHIATGTYSEGMRLPPERELCQTLNVSRVTLRKALVSLVDEGVLSASHGRGWYVSKPGTAEPAAGDWPNSLESFSETAARMGLESDSIVIDHRVSPATLDEAEELAVAPGTPLLRLGRVRRLGGVPIAIDNTRLPAALIAGGADIDFSTASLFATLGENDIDIARSEATIEARDADAAIAGHLDIEVGRPILVMKQLSVDTRDRPVLISTIEYSGDRYRLRTVFTRSKSRR
ncbi:GntR family transcriptional regulator [Herbiconiux daphne]|uniref:GntR family transcriptional regulator n=1 Tax=Herbiconiux daphne TaxID=2970914 RepID=A0ABT2H3F4_9MICO|nr:GntR family transcriptional regulator [Herbiconiux daphne]MCS5734460.1 GntR family transcriptional regulator [Herbiconiux daphne]